jgi:hypothetical protein
MLFRRSGKKPNIAIGSVYERHLQENIKEQAEVTWLGDDPFGIPHVRFNVVFPGIDESRDARLLAVATFQERYAQAGAA